MVEPAEGETPRSDATRKKRWETIDYYYDAEKRSHQESNSISSVLRLLSLALVSFEPGCIRRLKRVALFLSATNKHLWLANLQSTFLWLHFWFFSRQTRWTGGITLSSHLWPSAKFATTVLRPLKRNWLMILFGPQLRTPLYFLDNIWIFVFLLEMKLVFSSS